MNRTRRQLRADRVRDGAAQEAAPARGDHELPIAETDPASEDGQTPASPGARLNAYRAKRDPGRTPEPFGPEAEPSTASTPRLFVIQKHSARRLHYDLRLEWKGALHSWAVTNGFPLDPAERRMAVEVEDHPMDYANFEGVIPKGNYGAGAAIVWDRGHWTAREGPGEGIDAGKLHFELKGYKLRGTWILVRMKDDPRSWLLMRKLEKGEQVEPVGEESILSGLTVEEVLRGEDPAASLRAELEKIGASRAFVDPAQIEIMQATVAPKPFSIPGWIFEIKYDGYRGLGSRIHGIPSLRSRGGEEMAPAFPEIARAFAALPFERIVIDGELVVLDEAGRPSFPPLQRRFQTRRALDAERAARETPATFFAFDLLAVEGFDLRGRPLLERKALLRRVLPRYGAIRYCDHIEERGAEAFETIRSMGLEGLMAKRADSRYVAGRSALWQKLVTERTGDFAIVGYTAMRTEPSNGASRAGRDARALGALHLAAAHGGAWTYVGRVGTGFSDGVRGSLPDRLAAFRRAAPICAIPARERSEKGSIWVEPKMVAEVRYRSITESGMLRASAFLRLREDKSAEECEAPVSLRGDSVGISRDDDAESAGSAGAEGDGERTDDDARGGSPDDASGVSLEDVSPDPDPPANASRGRSSGARKVPFTHLEKVYWPEDGLTKGDLIEHYRAVAPRMLAYLKDRPVVVTRYPDGIDGKSFYQKDAPGHIPSWIRTARIHSTHAGKEISYFLCDDVESLLYIANLGSIPIHLWSSRASTIQYPDWCILDLDPKGAPFAHVIRLALAFRDLCQEIEIPSFVKTTGSSGLHVLLPLPPATTFDQSRILAQLLCALIEARHRAIATTERVIEKRGGKVYLDALQNRSGQLLVAPYSVRPLPRAPVSAPLEWSEVREGLEPRAFTIRNLPERLLRQTADPMLPLLSTEVDLLCVLERLEERMGRE